MDRRGNITMLGVRRDRSLAGQSRSHGQAKGDRQIGEGGAGLSRRHLVYASWTVKLKSRVYWVHRMGRLARGGTPVQGGPRINSDTNGRGIRRERQAMVCSTRQQAARDLREDTETARQ